MLQVQKIDISQNQLDVVHHYNVAQSVCVGTYNHGVSRAQYLEHLPHDGKGCRIVITN